MNLDNADILSTFERYRPNFEALRLCVYGSTAAEDMLLLRWWLALNESGDIEKLITPEHRRLASFLQIFQPPTVTFYSLSPSGEIDFLAWFRDPSGESIFCGIWLAPSIRGSRRSISLVQNVYSLVFEFYSSILGATWQPDLLQLHQKIGYAVVGNFKNFMGQDLVYLVQLTREDWRNSRLMQMGRK